MMKKKRILSYILLSASYFCFSYLVFISRTADDIKVCSDIS